MFDFFPKRLKEERKRLGFIQDVMAKHGGVSKGSYCAYEAGTTEPSVSFLAAIAAVGVDTQYLLTGVRAHVGGHCEDLQEYPEIGTQLVFEMLLFIETHLAKTDKKILPANKVELIKSICRIHIEEKRKSAKQKVDLSEANVVSFEKFRGVITAAST